MHRFFCLTLIATVLSAQPAPVLGDWQGTLDAGTAKLRLAFHIVENKDGGLAATLDSLDQNARGIPVQEVTFADGRLSLKLAAIKAEYVSMLNPQGTLLTGTFTQQGIKFALTLQRQETVAAVRRPQTPRPPFPYDSEDVAFQSRGSKLAGTLTRPRGPGPFPAVLLIGGSGPQDRDETLFSHKPFLVIADALTRRGIAVLRVDDPGVGGSQGTPGGQTLEEMADDALASVAFLKSAERIDRRNVGIVGHSEGGIVGPMAAAQSADIAFVVMLAGPGVRGGDLLRAQGELFRQASGNPPAVQAMERRIQTIALAAIEQESDPAAARRAMTEEWQRFRSGLPEGPRATVSAPEMNARIEREFDRAASIEVRAIVRSDAPRYLRRVKVPMLALAGARDVQVPPAQNLPAIAAALAEGGNPDVTIALLPGLNHLFQTCRQCSVSEYGEIEETFASAALDALSGWLDGHLRSR